MSELRVFRNGTSHPCKFVQPNPVVERYIRLGVGNDIMHALQMYCSPQFFMYIFVVGGQCQVGVEGEAVGFLFSPQCFLRGTIQYTIG